MSDTVRIKVWVRTDRVGSECSEVVEFDKKEWDSASDDEKESALRDTVWNMAEWGWDEE
ncbi:hypothetical protein [Rhizobium sp. LCM 4573]|uniref:DUF7167 family protein n=1 Tax=Rhizobium sp. LCM 4573 TaxID=1848291 RepID=UPI0012FF99B4|nr:hypothetical protein [Rhizobium sp. LCM 4573]